MSFGMANLHLRENELRPEKSQLQSALVVVPSTIQNLLVTPTLDPELVSRSDSKQPEDPKSDLVVVAKSNWKQPEGGWNLPSIPSYYPMEKTFQHISAEKGTPTIIAARVSDACVKMSIFALYNSDKGMAHLTSADFVEFYVFMFKTSASTDSRGDGLVIEIQRRKGCTLSFHRYARKILSAAVGEEDIDFDDPATQASNVNALTEKMMQGEDFQTCFKTERKHTIDALEIAGNLLTKDRLDANILGMESLCLLTDPCKTGTFTSSLVSRVILCGTMRPTNGVFCEKDGISDESSLEEETFLIQSLNIRGRIMSLIKSKKLSNETDGDSSDDDDLVSNQEQYGDYADHMHNLALATLSNALNNIAEDGCLEKTCSQQAWLNGTELVSTLIDVLKQAECRPHDAVLSARCLGSLVQASKEATERAVKMDALAVVEAAKHVGNLRHANLARESGGLHEKLSSVGAVKA
jgi:hypothetical protein